MRTDRPLCFVLMPFGTRKDPASQVEVNFDAVYEQAVLPAIQSAGLEAIRADEERAGGIIHRDTFERLLLCDFAIADLTTGTPNVYYELGVRHAVRPSTTIMIFAGQQRLPFDLNNLKALSYRLGESNRFGPKEAGELSSQLAHRLQALQERPDKEVDSPIFQLLSNYVAPNIQELKTDRFRAQVTASLEIKKRLRRAREFGESGTVEAIESELGNLESAESGILVDLYLTWRALSKWDRMIALYERCPAVLKRSVLVREQYAFALNRQGRRSDALAALESVLSQQGPSSETLGLIGRIYKDMWMESRRQAEDRAAARYLDKAIDAYVRGFETDWRDSYPGINAVTLLDIQGGESALRKKTEILPVVRFAVTQRLSGSKPIYWDYATLLELFVLENNETEANRTLSDGLFLIREPWEALTTSNNLKLIREARQVRGLAQGWLDEIIEALESRGSMTSARSVPTMS